MKNFLIHKRFMRIALDEARKGSGRVSPNPKVGCVVVKNDRILARGYHQRFGGPHAELVALKKAGKEAKGATLYITLEPCCYFGKTPPCANTIIESGIKEVVAAMADPNPANNGRGFKLLRKKGIKVTSGILMKEARALNKPFIERMKKKRPYISLKLAQSIDGKIATRTGESKWISSEGSRAIVQRLRSRHDAIMVGANTIVRDDPLLNIRSAQRQPARIVVDSRLRIPVNARIFSKDSPAEVIIATTKRAPIKKEKALVRKGAKILSIKNNSSRVDLKALMKRLSRMGITSILAEGGGELSASLFSNNLVDKIYLFIAPILIGGRDAVTSLEGEGISRIKDAFKLDNIKLRRIGKDFLVEANVHRNS